MKLRVIQLPIATITRLGEHSPTGTMIRNPDLADNEIEIDEDNYKELKLRADLERTSIAEIVRKLVF